MSKNVGKVDITSVLPLRDSVVVIDIDFWEEVISKSVKQLNPLSCRTFRKRVQNGTVKPLSVQLRQSLKALNNKLSSLSDQNFSIAIQR